jgi:hypothetical protein
MSGSYPKSTTKTDLFKKRVIVYSFLIKRERDNGFERPPVHKYFQGKLLPLFCYYVPIF